MYFLPTTTHLSQSTNHIPQHGIMRDIDDISASKSTDTDPFHLSLRGTIIPKEWKTLTTSSGKKLSRGALELYSIIVSWYNCKKVLDTETGKYKFVPKFDGDELRKNYDYFTKELDRSQEQVRRYFAELKSANLVTVELRTVTHKNWRYHNTLCITLNKEAEHFIKTQDANIQTTGRADSCNKDMQDNLQITSNSLLTPTLKDKKIWPSPCKKVGFTPQKSGALYIDKTTLKTNIKIDLIDLGESNFVKKDFFKNVIQFKNLEQESISAAQLPSDIVLGQGSALKTLGSLPRKLLLEFYPLLEKDAIELRKTSGREFSLSYINKLLLKLAEEKPDHGFYTKTLFLSYMSKVLACELRQAPIVNNIDFAFAAKLGTSEYDSKQKALYLDNIEKSTDTSLSSQLKRKIAGRFCSDEAYAILTQCSFRDQTITDPEDNASLVVSEYLIETQNPIITLQKAALSQIVKEVFGEGVEVTFKDKTSTTIYQNLGQGSNHNIYERLELQSSSSSPLWDKVRQVLIKNYGAGVDKSWFSKLELQVDRATKDDKSPISKLTIKAATKFVQDWVKSNYGDRIESIILDVINNNILEYKDDYDTHQNRIQWTS